MHYQQVEPTVVVEVEVDNAVDGVLAKPWHRVRYLRVRVNLKLEDVPLAGSR